jgi:hypothetical protein
MEKNNVVVIGYFVKAIIILSATYLFFTSAYSVYSGVEPEFGHTWAVIVTLFLGFIIDGLMNVFLPQYFEARIKGVPGKNSQGVEMLYTWENLRKEDRRLHRSYLIVGLIQLGCSVALTFFAVTLVAPNLVGGETEQKEIAFEEEKKNQDQRIAKLQRDLKALEKARPGKVKAAEAEEALKVEEALNGKFVSRWNPIWKKRYLDPQDRYYKTTRKKEVATWRATITEANLHADRKIEQIDKEIQAAFLALAKAQRDTKYQAYLEGKIYEGADQDKVNEAILSKIGYLGDFAAAAILLLGFYFEKKIEKVHNIDLPGKLHSPLFISLRLMFSVLGKVLSTLNWLVTSFDEFTLVKEKEDEKKVKKSEKKQAKLRRGKTLPVATEPRGAGKTPSAGPYTTSPIGTKSGRSCKQCGGDMSHKRKGAKFCSVKCKDDYNNEHGSSRKKKTVSTS